MSRTRASQSLKQRDLRGPCNDDPVITFEAVTVTSLPVDELAMHVLADLVASGAWSENNYLTEASQDRRYASHRDAVFAISEALTWLRGRGLIALKPGQTNDSAIFVTRAGHETLTRGLRYARATARLQEGLHPVIEERADGSSCSASTSRRCSCQ